MNRAFVQAGLKILRARRRPGLRALADVARMDGPPTTYHLGYLLGPRINAGGRIGAANLGARLLATDDDAEADAFAERLDLLNTERRGIEAAVTQTALAAVEARVAADPTLAWAAGAGWHPGVVGIVAGRLKEATGLPAVVLGIREDGMAQGSARSVPGVDIGAAVQRLAAEGLILKGGGHPMAAGLSVAADRIDAAMARLSALISRAGSDPGAPRDLTIDAILMPRAATRDLVAALERAGPFGQGAPGPRFAFPDLRVAHARPVGEGHLKLTFTGGGPGRLDAIAFRANDTGIADAVTRAAGAPIHVAGRLELNRWQGREDVQLKLEDLAATEISSG